MTDQAASFNEIADLYTAVRPAYPAALFNDLQEMGALSAASRVLEVGCGSGQATSDLCDRAASVLAIDPGQDLIAAARKRIAAANVTFQVSRFEDFAAPDGAFDLVASAQAWHWIDPALACARAADLLSTGGHLATFGNVPMPIAGELQPLFRRAFERHAPQLWGKPPPQAAYRATGPFARMIEASRAFGAVTHRAYPWIWIMTTETFGQYLRTDSSYRVLPEDVRSALFADLSAAVARCGGEMAAPWETHLHLAPKRRTGTNF